MASGRNNDHFCPQDHPVRSAPPKYHHQCAMTGQDTNYERGCDLKKRKLYDQALKAFFECIENENVSSSMLYLYWLSELVEKCKEEVMNTLEFPDLKEISPDVTLSIHPSFWKRTILELQDSNRWRVIFFLLNGGGNKFVYGMGGLATGCSVYQVSILRCLKSGTKNVEKIEVVKALLKNGANPNGLLGEDESPVKYCLRVPKYEHYLIITALIRNEARPEDLIEVRGDSPLHSGLRICLKYKDKKMDLLNVLLDKYSKTMNYRYLDPTSTNTHDADSLFHIALNESDGVVSLEAVKFLSRNKVNPYLKNKAGKIPITQIKRSDRRYQFLEEAARYYPHSALVNVSPLEPPDSIQKFKHDKRETSLWHARGTYGLRANIARLINDVLPVIRQNSKHSTRQQSEMEDDDESRKAEKKRRSGEPLDLQETDSTIFDNLPWEIECTEKVWKFLRNRHVPEKIKKAVINKIRRLGEGNWSKSLAIPVSCKTVDHKIYMAKVTSGGRILWQKAIVFSPEHSVVHSEGRLTGVASGRIYTDAIRVWNVVLDNDNVQREIQLIVKSVDRGHTCIIQKKLKCIKDKSIGQETQSVYEEDISEDESEMPSKKPYFFPPANSNELEYNVVKFYSFSASLVNKIFQDSRTRVDFPFRVTEKEHAIIHINPQPPCSILLLGRSGTGKTTCCLYRLWSSFVAYWNNAAGDGNPRIPRDLILHHSKESAYKTLLEGKTNKSAMMHTDVFEGAASNQDGTENKNEVYDHLHQLFITKNRVLCSEVRKNFREFAHGCNVASHYIKAENQQHPHRLQDAPTAAFPYFLNSKEFLLMLDASLPGRPFFERKPDGSLKKNIRGWQGDDDQQLPLAMIQDDSDSDDEDSEEDIREFDPDIEEKVQREKAKYDVRREVTYEVFASHFWTKINKKRLNYHPTLVWIEFRSFIKGSIEALHTVNGMLNLEDYQKIGKKRATNFTGDRSEVFELFKNYEHMKRQHMYFDEADVVFNIYRRLQDVEVPDWAIHQIYVDETQDFTQAELALLIRCCSDPNALFLTGDTAQSIMRGIAFRFEDIKSLFHYARSSMKTLGKRPYVTVPKTIYQLTHNYRSHAGILELAASVVDLLVFFFPNSFDQLKRDQGLFNGPKPILLDSCSIRDLAVILRGNKRTTTKIEFGANQVVLVANEQTKEQLPKELKQALCLTIFEAKGLEFDDVMIYNFFTDSPSKVFVTSNARLKAKQVKVYGAERSISEQQSSKSTFKTEHIPSVGIYGEKYGILLDQGQSCDATFKTNKCVSVGLQETERDISRQSQSTNRPMARAYGAQHSKSDQSQSSDPTFISYSSKEDFEKRGDYFSNNGVWELAVDCYIRAGNNKKAWKAKANYSANEAVKLKGKNEIKKNEWILDAAFSFMHCGMYNEAARCLFSAKEYEYSAQLFEKIGDVVGAAKIYDKRLKIKDFYDDASRCHEKCGNYAKAVEVLKDHKEYDKAADVIERFEQLLDSAELPENFEEPPDIFDTCCRQAAEHHYQHQSYNEMLAALDRLPNVDDRITFLKLHKQHLYAAEILKSKGRLTEAAECHLKLGKQKLRQLGVFGAHDNVNPNYDFRFKLPWNTPRDVSSLKTEEQYDLERKALEEDIKKQAKESLRLLSMSTDLQERLFGDYNFILAKLNKNVYALNDAQRYFHEANSDAGQMECIHLRIRLQDSVPISNIINYLSKLHDFIQVLKHYDGSKKQTIVVKSAEYFYDIDLGASTQAEVKQSRDQFEHARIKVVSNHCLPKAVIWFKLVKEKLEKIEMKTKQWNLYAVGIRPCTKQDILKLVDCYLSMIRLVHCATKWKPLIFGDSGTELQSVTDAIIEWKFQPCSKLYDLIFPYHCNRHILTENQGVIEDLLTLVRRSPEVKLKMTAWVFNLCKCLDTKENKYDSNVYLKTLNVHRLVNEDPHVTKQWKTWGMSYECCRMANNFMDKVLEYTNNLYVRGDTIEAITSCITFLVFITKQPSIPLLPSIANILAIIEHAFSVACAVTAKTQQCEVFLPASYLGQIQFQDELCRAPNRKFNFYQALDLTDHSKRNQLLGQVQNFVEMMAYGGEFPGFKIISDAFNSTKCIESGEAQRSLILALVMLCNYRTLLSNESAFNLRCQILTIQTDQHYPPRLAKAVKDVKNAKTLEDILNVLQELLLQRENESLLTCLWSSQRSNRYHKLNYKKVVPKHYMDYTISSLAGMHPVVISDHWLVVYMEDLSHIEDHWCALCEKELHHEEDEKDQTQMPSDSSKGDEPTNLHNPMEQHVLSDEHTENQKLFEDFKLEITNTLPVFEETYLLYRCLQNCSHEDKDVYFSRVREDQCQFEETVEEVMEERRWKEFGKIYFAWWSFDMSVRDLMEHFKQL
ncbi:TPR and ankyrin repeat-containing protein 1-like [Anneissia japonica]|uniref:TPR and ankyrin repeat-containing protein 1-like n=1 Tax=Anneissia japonica TaxID=1529436 RepID=UPI001425854A|nr:TPR and ankyrin repeat-containing protein 1-like [Anneissia japonica]